jgi:hypothetical protein
MGQHSREAEHAARIIKRAAQAQNNLNTVRAGWLMFWGCSLRMRLGAKNSIGFWLALIAFNAISAILWAIIKAVV